MALAQPPASTPAGLENGSALKHGNIDATTDPDHPHPPLRRQSCVHDTPIPEEDESNEETASEPQEPITPTSDSHPPLFSHQEGNVEHSPEPQQPEMKTKPASLMPVARPPPAARSNTHNGTNTHDEATPKRGLTKRVGSFVRNRLHRSTSNTAAQVQNENVFVNTGLDDPAEKTSVVIPKTRRLSSFSFSARNTPKSSQSNTPPSPSSPSSTISGDHELEHSRSAQTPGKHKHSNSSTALSSMNSPRHGITWAGGGKDGKASKRPAFPRRRSHSTDLSPQAKRDDATGVDLMNTFSKPAVEGVGMKARRLSLSLPDEFVVDSCELDKEFKSSSLMPGKRGKCLGKGATAEVRIMARRGTLGGEDLVAVKEFRHREKDEKEDEYIKKIKSEYSIAKSLHHPNVVETVRLCTNRGRWNHVMEFCNYGELYSLVERKLFAPDGYYSLNDRLCFFKQLLRGVDYLHSHGIAHRDIKLENLLLDKSGHLKISDFGVAEVFSGEHPGLRAAQGECGKNMGAIRLSKPGICGSLPYIAPEVLEKKGEYDPRPLDVWSCAIVFLTMTFGGCPWQAAKPQFENYARFKKGWDDWLPNHPDGQITEAADGQPKCGKLFAVINPPPVRRLMVKMLHPLPDKRISIRNVLNTPYVKSIDCCCLESYEDLACTIDTTKYTSKETSKMTAQKKFLHHHIPPKPEKRIAKAFEHRFDMGEGWA